MYHIRNNWLIIALDFYAWQGEKPQEYHWSFKDFQRRQVENGGVRIGYLFRIWCTRRVELESSTVALIIFAAMLVLYMTELVPIAVTSVCACLAFAVFGIVPLNTAFAGFGNDIVFLVAGMVVVGNALFETGVAQVFGKKMISVVGTNERAFILALTIVITALSLFLNNTATVTIMLPITASAISMSGGKLSKKNTYMMVGIITVISGGLTLIGSTPQLIAQGVLAAGGYETIGFWEIGKIGFPVLIMALVFYMTAGNALQKKIFSFPEVIDSSPDDSPGESKASPKNNIKMYISVGILILCIIGFITELWSMGIVAMAGASLCVITGCISQKKVFEKMDWTTLVIMGCSFGFSAGLDKSGAGRLVAQSIINIFGDSMSPWLLCAAFALAAMILTNCMSSTATASLMVPIAVFAALELGYNVKNVVMAAAIAANLGYATPISTPPITMTLAGGYRFKDYIKVGGLLNLLTFILLTLLFPIMLSF